MRTPIRTILQFILVFLTVSVSLAGQNKTETIRIRAVGDMVPGTTYPNNNVPSNPRRQLFGDVESILKDSDITFGNFESTLTNYPKTAKNTNRKLVFAFRSPPAFASMLKSVGFGVLNIANNHSLDFYPQGFTDTAKNLRSAGVVVTGEKGEITYNTVNGVPFAWIGFSHLDFHNSVNDIASGKALVEKAKRKARIVVISIHGGAEGPKALHVKNEMERFYGEYRGNLVAFSHAMIDSGADLVIGHGPHVPRAMEVYKGRLVAYSLGNFMGYHVFSTRGYNGYSLVLEANLKEDGEFTGGKIIPLYLDSAGIPHPDPKEKVIDLLKSLNRTDFPRTGVKVSSQGILTP